MELPEGLHAALRLIQWGTVGEWVAAMAAAVPLVFWAVERKERKATQAKLDKREQFEDDERLVYQAARTAFWHKQGHEYLIRNYSDLPLRSVALAVRRPLGGDGSRFGRISVDQWDVIPPMETMSASINWSLDPDAILVLEFTDSRGTRWERWQSGELKRIWTLSPNTSRVEDVGR